MNTKKEVLKKVNQKNSVSYVFREAKVPEPIEKVGNDPWVKWGEHNLYPQFLYKLFYQSPIHSGIINTKVKYITSGGLEYKGTDVAKWEQLKKNGTAPMTLDELVSALYLDFEVLDEFYIKCTFNTLLDIWEYRILDAELMRNTEDGVYFHYSKNWQGQQNEKTGHRTYKNVEYMTPEDKEVVLYISTKAKQYQMDNNKLTCNVYPIPNYAGSIVSIMADIEMNSFHYSESVNGFTGGTVFMLNNGTPEDDDKRALERDLKESVTDRKKKGGVTILYSDGKERQPDIKQLNGNDNDKRYLETQRFIAESIMVGHGVVSPSLFGIKTSGQLGTTQELQTAYSIFKQNYATHRQRYFEDAITYLNNKLNGLTGEIKFKDYNISFQGSVDENNKIANAINNLSPLLQTKILESLTLNEIRNIAGAKPVEGGDEIPKAPAQSQFSSQYKNKIVNELSKIGVDKTKLTILKSRKVEKFDSLDTEEETFKTEFKYEQFAVSNKDKKILGMIDEGVTFNDIVKELGDTSKSVAGRIQKLIDDGLVSKSESGKIELTDSGKAEVSSVSFKVLYTYEENPDAPALLTQSREFCVEMMSINKAFTREEINRISNDQDTDVWLYRGGWYHNPETDKNQPSCRHFWQMNLVAE